MSDFRAFLGEKGLFSAKMFFMRRLASLYHACYPFALLGVCLLRLFTISGQFFWKNELIPPRGVGLLCLLQL